MFPRVVSLVYKYPDLTSHQKYVKYLILFIHKEKK